jgi:hypothetical protein
LTQALDLTTTIIAMISKDKAEAAAEAIISLERKRLVDARDARAPRIPTRLRVDGLLSFAPRHQAALLREAERTVGRRSLKLWAVAWAASGMLFWYLMRSDHTAWAACAFVPMFVGHVIQTRFIRRELKRLVSTGPGSLPRRTSYLER